MRQFIFYFLPFLATRGLCNFHPPLYYDVVISGRNLTKDFSHLPQAIAVIHHKFSNQSSYFPVAKLVSTVESNNPDWLEVIRVDLLDGKKNQQWLKVQIYDGKHQPPADFIGQAEFCLKDVLISSNGTTSQKDLSSGQGSILILGSKVESAATTLTDPRFTNSSKIIIFPPPFVPYYQEY